MTHRGTVSRELFDVVTRRYGLDSVSGHCDLEDSYNLNVVIWHRGRRLVVRVYRPSTNARRLAAVQRTRQFLIDGGLPFAQLRRTPDGAGWCEIDGRLIEVEEFVPSETYMETFAHIRLGMPMLARVHNRLRQAPMDQAAANAPVANHVDAAHVVDAVAAGLATLRGERLSVAETGDVVAAETLSHRLRRVADEYEDQLPRQLVHGDYWDDNVKFTGDRISLITDLDFMGNRPRIDDLALTLFYANERLGRHDTSAQRRSRLRELVDAYDGALRPRLSRTERLALPYAIARTPLCSAAELVRTPELSNDVLANRGPAWSWALAMISNPDWTTAFV